MKVVIISRILYLSGVTAHIRALGEELVKLGHDVIVYTSGNQYVVGGGDLQSSLEARGLKVKILNYPKVKSSKIDYLLGLVKSVFITRKALKEDKPDVIHVHTPVLSFIPRLLGYKFVTTIHLENLKLGIFHANATQEIAISKETYKDALKRGCDENRVNLIFNGVETKFADPISQLEKEEIKRNKGIPQDKTIISFVGTICYRKGLDLLLKAGADLYNAGIKNFHINLIGNPDTDQDKDWITELFNENKANDFATLYPYSDPLPFYQTTDIFVLPSRQEGFPLVVCEAMLAGCCVVRGNCAGASDQIEDGIDGFVFENGNANELKAILFKLLNNKELMQQTASRGKEKAIKEFTAPIMANKTVEVYKKALNHYK